VETGTELEPQSARSVSDRQCAPDRTGWAVEGGEEAVPRRVDLAAAEKLQLAPDRRLLSSEQFRPFAVAEITQPLGRTNEIREEDGR